MPSFIPSKMPMSKFYAKLPSFIYVPIAKFLTWNFLKLKTKHKHTTHSKQTQTQTHNDDK